VKKGVAVVLFLLMLLLSSAKMVSAAEDVFTPADAAMTAKQYPQAKELYRQIFISSTKDSDAARALLGIAKADYHLKNYYESDINLKRFFKSFKNTVHDDEAHLVLGLDRMNIHNYKEAEVQLDLVKGDFQEKATIAKAEIAFIQGGTDKAEKLLAKLDRNAYENDNRVLYIRAMILSRQEKHEQAIQTINKIPDQVLKAENIAVSKAIIYYNARKYIDSKDMLIAIINAPSSRIEAIEAKRTLFQIYEAENNQDEALKLAAELILFEPTDELRLKAVSLFEKKGDLDDAFLYLTYLNNKKTLSEELEKRLKKLQDDKDPKADNYLLKYFNYLSIDSPYTIEAAKYMDQKGYKEQAKRLLQKAARGRNRAEASMVLAQMFIRERKFTEAKRLLTPITTDANYSGQAAVLLYEIFENEGNVSAAAEYRARAIRVLETQKDYSRVGDLYVRSGNNAEALKNYIRAAHKDDAISILKAADLYYLSGKHDAAKVYYKKAIDSGIKDPKSLQWADYQYGKLAKDNEYLKKAEGGGGAVAEAAGLLRSE
jgi:tetratricopeptide (TPR) repeat protein